MAYKFLDMLTTDSVRDAQSDNGVREQWEDFSGDRRFDHFDERAAAFIAARDSFYMASVSENGWALCPASRRSDRFSENTG